MTEVTMPKLPLFVFDFDGVVCDSTDECMVTSWNAWQRGHGGTSFRTDLSDFSLEECKSFRALRPRVRGAGEYYILRRSLAEGITILDQKSYDGLLMQWKEHIAPFSKVFFEMRDQLRNIDLEGWIELHPVYPEVLAVMRELNRHGRLYIATLKDAKSVRLILERHGIVVSMERLLDESIIDSKLQALDLICNHAACSKTDLVFIDDNATHLVEPHASGYTVRLATWGAPLKEYINLAVTKGIQILNTQSAIRSLAYGRETTS